MSERLKFRNVHIGGTSWVIQGTFAENMRELSKDVDDMEIVLFDTPQGSNIPKKDEVMELRGLCQELGMTCTVHFPEDVCFSTDAAERTRCEDQCLRTAELFAPLEPFAWILHLDGEHRGGFPSYDMDSWREKTAKSAERIAASVEDRTKICVENLDFDYALVNDIVKDTGLSVCIDVGHLLKTHSDVKDNFAKYLGRTRLLHIHGMKPDGTDHVDMSYFDTELLSWIMKELESGQERVMSMEVFDDDYARSVKVMRAFNNIYK